MFQITCLLTVILLSCKADRFFKSSIPRAELTPMEILLYRIEQYGMNPNNSEPVNIRHRTYTQQKIRKVYDFIVVGSGPGGATIANRLSEIPEFKVLLIEAGDNVTELNDVPIAAGYFQQIPWYNWGYRTIPKKHACHGLNGRRSMWPRGKGLGGSSILNYMIYTRGDRRDFDGWENMGNTGWGWEEALKYYKKSENARGVFDESSYHNKDGYLSIEEPPYKTPLADVYLQGMQELGMQQIDYNCGQMMGFSFLQATMRDGLRCSSNKAFITPVLHRPNLHVLIMAHVTRVKIDPTTKRAEGVYFKLGGEILYVRANLEVILSAGALNTPQILLLSGIGPSKHLKSVGIDTIVDLPGVGRNLQDHIIYPGLTFLVNDSVSLVERRFAFNIQNYYKFLTHKTGSFTIPGGVEGLGFIRTPISDTPDDYPDIEFMFISGALNSDDGRIIRRNIGLTAEIYNVVYKPINSKDAFSIWPLLFLPKSHGYVKLRSKNPFDEPIMDGNYFSEKHDLDTMVEGIMYALKLLETKAFRRYNTTLHDIPLPSCKHYKFLSRAYWVCAVQQMTTTIYHQCCTAKMGPSSDRMAVVDPELRVHGITNLRVVDASCMPKIPAAHTSAPTYMIAEKAADLIKKSYNKL